MVTWNDVQIFLKKLNEMTGKKYRLPTEVEWEFAAKGGTNENRYVFSGSNNIDSVAWYGNNSEGKTHEAGSKAPNALGLYDMSGNVYEWCNSSYTEDLTHYLNTPSAVASGGDKVLKGGSWRHTKRQAKVSFRWYNGSDIKSEWYGFRLALDKE
jgi:formylglycine-generating enzyme required for sulfatase activity